MALRTMDKQSKRYWGAASVDQGSKSIITYTELEGAGQAARAQEPATYPADRTELG
jgi:hypothetical protein